MGKTGREWRHPSHRNRKNWRALRTVEDFGFFVDDNRFMIDQPHLDSNRPVRGFSNIMISLTPGALFEIYREIFKSEDEQEQRAVRYWLDTSFIVTSAGIYGEFRGKQYRISTRSFLNAYSVGFGNISPEGDEIWKRFHEIECIHNNKLEKIVERHDVSVLPEVVRELEVGNEWRGRSIQTMHDAYKKTLEQIMLARSRLIKMIKEKQQHDSALSSVMSANWGEVSRYCEKVAYNHSIGTSKIDNAIVVSALINSTANHGQPQIVLTGDNGIASLLKKLSEINGGMVGITVKNGYYSPLRMHQLEVSATLNGKYGRACQPNNNSISSYAEKR